MTVRVRGIYATALTALLEDVVQASPPICRRFESSFPVAPARATVEATADRQGVGVHGAPERVETITERLRSLASDTLAWETRLPRDAVYAGEVVETLGSGALVACEPDADGPPAGDRTGFLPYSKTTRHVETGETLRVQVDEPRPPWTDGRPVLETTLRIQGTLASLARGGTARSDGPELADIVPAEPPEGWALDWGTGAEEADLDALGEVIELLGDRARGLEEAVVDAPEPDEVAPHRYWAGVATRWVWFGRESRFALDDHRRGVTATMPGHHRTKAGSRAASDAVDFVERVCEGSATDTFPFDAVATQFGPETGATLAIGHGKPDGRRIELGTGEVVDRDPDGNLRLRRELSAGGTYDALDVEIQAGDVAVTKFQEGRWWYPTVYRGEDGTRRGTYVNVCTPVEIFPDEVRYVDLHVDVIKHADGTVERVDDDELDAAVEAGLLRPALAERAREVAAAVATAL
jgi:hypothetical protein